jgi:iron complex outermembrane recepter protein
MNKLIFILIFFISAFNFVYGQKEKEDKDTMKYYLNTEIIVTAPRMNLQLKNIPFSTSVINSDVINTVPRLIAVDEALKLVPGVKIDNQADGMRVHMSIRGQGILTERGIRGIKILYDGLPQNDPSGFAPDFFDIDFATVDKIEVLRGPGASLYGGSSSAGIINILSKDSPLRPYFGEAMINYGSTNFWKALGRFGGAFNKFNYTVNFSRNLGEGYRIHTHYQGDNIYAKANIIPSSSFKITPIISYIDVYHENAEGLNPDQYRVDPKQANGDAIPFNEYLETKRFSTGVVGQWNHLYQHVVDFNAFYKNTKFTEANNKTFSDRTIDNFGGTLQYTLNTGKPKSPIINHFSVGSDINYQKFNATQQINILTVRDAQVSNADIKQTGIGAFAIEKIDFGKHWSAMLSGRYDQVKNELTDLFQYSTPDSSHSGSANFNNTTGRFGLTFAPIEEANFFANWGQGFLPPATEELVQNPDAYGGFNTHLTYAKSNGFDFGIRGTIKDMFYYDVTGFYLKTENDFDRYRVPERGVQTFYTNTGASNRMGVELYSKFTPIRPLKIELAYTFASYKYKIDAPKLIVMDDTTIHKFIQDGNYLPNSPQHQLYFDIQYSEILPHITIGLSGEALSKWFIDGANIETEAAQGYALLHGRIVYTAKLKNIDYEISFNVKNIADKQYVAFTEPDPGGNSYQPAARRQFFGGFKIRF